MKELFAVLPSRTPALLLLIAIIIGYLYSYAVGHQGRLQTLGYLASIFLLAWILRPVREGTIARGAGSRQDERPSGLWLPKSYATGPLALNELLVFAAIVGFGVVLRCWRWESVPQGLWIDELLATANALRVLDGQPAHLLGTLPMKPESPEWVHTFNLYTYYVVLNVKLFGSGHFGIKMLSILPGCVTLAAFYWLLREIQGPRLAAMGTLILAMNRWHLTHSRVNWDVTFMMALGVLALASLVRGLRADKPQWVALGGIFLGLTQFSYVGSRLLAAGVFGWLALLTLVGQKRFRGFRSRACCGLAICLLAFLVTSAPVWLFTLHTNRAVATSRIRQVSIVDFKRFSVDLKTLEARIKRHAEAFVLRGPENARANIPGAPLLLAPMAALAGAGALVHLALRRGIAHPMTWSLFVWGLLNGVLTRGNEVTAQRIVFILPALCLWAAHALQLAGVVLVRLGSSIQERFGEVGRRAPEYVATAMIAVAILYPGLRDTYDYFAVYGRSDANRRAMENSREVLVARAAGDYRGTHQIWIDSSLRLNKLAMDVLFWRPRKELYGRVVGGLDDPSYRFVRFSDSLPSIPHPEIDLPIALVSTLQRPGELSGIFGQIESREFSNWDGTRPLFSMSFLEIGDLREKSADRQLDAEPAFTPSQGLGPTAEEVGLLREGHGLLGTYYDGPIWDVAAQELPAPGIPDSRILRRRFDPVIDFVWRGGAKPAARFSVEWKGFLQVDESAEYTLATESDDGSAVYVDGRRIVDNWGRHTARRREGRILLEEGSHALTILYDDRGGGAKIRFLWRREGRPFSVVPGRNLHVMK